MASTRQMGRPIVVVTGIGIVTSLGAGKADNWATAHAGQSGIHAITRFPTEGLRTRIAGTVDFLPVDEPFCSPQLSETLRRARGRGGDRRSRHRRSRRFPGPAVPGGAADRDRMAAAHARSPPVTAPTTRSTYDDILRALRADASAPITTASCSARSPTISPTSSAPRARRSRSRPPARRARRAIQLGVEAIRRGETDAALCIGTDGSINPEGADPLLAALGALDQQRRAGRGAPKPFSQEPRRLRHGGRRRRRWCWKSYDAAKARGATILGVCAGLRRDGRRLPPHPLEPRRRADHRLHPRGPRRCRPRPGRHRLHQRPRHRHAGERQDGSVSASSSVRRAHRAACRSRPTNR